MTGPRSFVLQLKEFGLQIDHLTNGFMTSMPRVFIFLIRVFFVILVPCGFLSHYSNIGSSHWLREGVNRIIDKVFSKNLWFKWLRHFLALFY